ncbi:Uncharacterised protein [Mycobacterium tuberculosis]|nr:Uncharacterised protein [Mycobacterium tuberculosis]
MVDTRPWYAVGIQRKLGVTSPSGFIRRLMFSA